MAADREALLAGRYGYEAEVGRGASGRVIAVVDRGGDRLVAKILAPDEGARAMWELDALSSVASPHLPRVRELLRVADALGPPWSVAAGAWALVQTRASGEPSSKVLTSIADVETRASRIASATAGVLRALAALHAQGLSHGDVKPDNVLVEADHATLVDLGAAAPFGRSEHVSGTPSFMAPEAREGERSPAADLFSLGATIHAWATGEPPREGEALSFPSWLGAPLTTLATRLLAHAVGDRPHDAMSALATLEGRREVPFSGATHRPRLVGAAGAVAKLLAVLDSHGWAVVVGPSGSGRSRIAEEAARAIQRREARAGRLTPTYLRAATLPTALAGPAVVHLEQSVPRPLIERLLISGRVQGLEHRVIVETDDAAGVDRSRLVRALPLGDDEVGELLFELTGERASDAACASCREATGGFAGRVVRGVGMLRSLGLDPHRPGSWREAARLVEEGRELPRHARAVVELAAVLGGEILPDGPWPDHELARGARWLLGQGLATLRADGSLVVRADLVAQVEGSAVRAAARTRAARLPLGGASRAIVLAVAGSAEGPRGILEAAAAARDRGAPEQARELLERYLAATENTSAPSRRDVERALADACRAAADFEAARRCLEGAVRSPGDEVALAELARLTADLSALDETWRKIEQAPCVERDRVRAIRARALLSVDPVAAREQARALASATDAWARARAAEVLALGSLSEGRFEEALQELSLGLRAALSIAPRHLRLAEEARLASVEAQALAHLGRLAEARTRHESSARLAEEAGERLLEATFRVNAGLAYLEGGKLGAALEALEQGARRLARLGRIREAARAIANLANACAISGASDRATELVAEAHRAAVEVGDLDAQLLVAVVRSELALRKGDVEGALNVLTSAPRSSSPLGAVLRARILACRAMLGVNISSDEARIEFEQADGGLARAEAALALARVAMMANELDEAARELERVEDLVRKGAVGFDVAVRGLLLEVEVEERRGRRAETRRALTRLRELLEPALRDLPPALQVGFRQLPGYGRALSEGFGETEARDPGRPAQAALSGITLMVSEPRPAAVWDRLAETALAVAAAERAFVVEWSADGPVVLARAGAARSDPCSRPSTFVVARALREGLLVSSDATSQSDASRSVHALALRSVVAVRVPGTRARVVVVDDRLRAGAFDADVVEALRAAASVGGALISTSTEHSRSRNPGPVRPSSEEESLDDPFASFVHVSESTARLVDEARRLAQSDLPLLIVGESGVGKDLLARAIHRASPRRHEAFVAELAGSLAGPLAEARLFGHVRGAFTGADSARRGLFELAHRGTLYLDDVGSLPPEVQAHLLRVLADGEVRPLGAVRTKRVDVRPIAAMREPPDDAVARGALRADLRYRLGGAVLVIPPLRERPEDIDALVDRILARSGRALRLSKRARAAILARRWPGNVRELEHSLARAALSATGSTIDVEALDVGRPHVELGPSETLHARRSALTRELVLEALEATGGNRSKTARRLGISRYGLQKILRRLGI